jgi:hypothetical protein
MNIKNVYNLSLLVFLLLISTGCGKNNTSRGTGWGINAKK